jgi:hypothetical protein
LEVSIASGQGHYCRGLKDNGDSEYLYNASTQKQDVLYKAMKVSSPSFYGAVGNVLVFWNKPVVNI